MSRTLLQRSYKKMMLIILMTAMTNQHAMELEQSTTQLSMAKIQNIRQLRPYIGCMIASTTKSYFHDKDGYSIVDSSVKYGYLDDQIIVDVHSDPGYKLEQVCTKKLLTASKKVTRNNLQKEPIQIRHATSQEIYCILKAIQEEKARFSYSSNFNIIIKPILELHACQKSNI